MNGSVTGTSVGDWPSDFWVGQTQVGIGPLFAPMWDLPERIDTWPGRGAGDFFDRGLPLNVTRSAARIERAETSASAVSASADPERVKKLTSPMTPEDRVIREQVFAWLHTAFGSALIGPAIAALADERSADVLSGVIVERITSAGSLSPGLSLDFGCAHLYNTEVVRQKLRAKVVRRGQGSAWQDFWTAISLPLTPETTAAAVERASPVLVNEALLTGLVRAFEVGDEGVRARVLCVTRRWLLTTKVLAWLSDALKHQWTDVRPHDLTCFAFAALSPGWPRPMAAVSHRSCDSKPVLAQLHMWKSPYVAVDSSSIPVWETNTGMIWSLFASTPLLVRVRSERYTESLWCRREAEILKYLADRSDFLERRIVGDITVDRLPELDEALFGGVEATTSLPSQISLPVPDGSFPYFSPVLMADFPAPLDLDVLRAAAALRLIGTRVVDPYMANGVAFQVVRDHRRLNIAPPTNNPGGWADYEKVFKALSAWDPQGNIALPMAIPSDYDNKNMLMDRLFAEQVPDLSSGQFDLMDVLAALEWSRTVLRWFIDAGLGDMTCIDVSKLSGNEWATAPDVSLARGLASLQGLTPTWIRQQAGQQADLWPDMPDYPIFTQYFPEQFSWMKATYVDPAWRLNYLANAGLELSSSLQGHVIAQVIEEAGREAVSAEETEDGGLRIDVPEPLRLFVTTQTVADEVRDIIGDS